MTADKARALEDAGRFEEALAAYQEAFDRSGQNLVLAGDMGRLALRLGQHAIAEKLLRLHLAAVPHSLASQSLLAHALREQHRYEEAIGVLSAALQDHPQEAALWAGLGTSLVQQGRPAEALPFAEEAIRLDPQGGGHRYLRANALADLGDHAAAIADYEAAACLVAENDRDRVRLPLALSRLALGDLEGGWADYEARLSPHGAKPVIFETSAKLTSFEGDAPLKGPLALIAEQGLGDEVMFANIVPDVQRALGDQQLVLVVEKRLVALFARSFPEAQVVAHRTWMDKGVRHRGVEGETAFDFWAPMAEPLRRYRPKASDFPAGPYLQADPARIAHWRALLAQRPGRKVGLLWKSLKLDGERLRSFAGFDLWRPVLETPGVSFVNLQYGDCAEELAYAAEQWGVEIWSPPGIDLKDDLDDVAALACALDLTLGFANASINLAGACGAPTWLIAPAGAWTMLGTAAYPWYPQVKVFTSQAGWSDALESVANDLRALSASC